MGEVMSHEVPGGDKNTTRGGLIMNRTRRVAACVACVLLMLVTGCSRKGPVSVRFMNSNWCSTTRISDAREGPW
jgi:hypothetical protein